MCEPPTSIDATNVATLRPALNLPGHQAQRRVLQRFQTKAGLNVASTNRPPSATNDSSSRTFPIRAETPIYHGYCPRSEARSAYIHLQPTRPPIGGSRLRHTIEVLQSWTGIPRCSAVGNGTGRRGG